MNTKPVIFGLIIFSITTITSFLILDLLTDMNDGMVVIIAIALGFFLEYLYRKRKA
ncbi:hypothetical protein [Alkalihalobacillus sp. BA299]|uniref:hypothetical protein n=1 Tax=Alkalihalobacillus sp. BA299 TaxID=2815938 RepID=UPI001ADCFBC9|nr:hypothetical protein [Alkalihalobacillus sp. BA299]